MSGILIYGGQVDCTEQSGLMARSGDLKQHNKQKIELHEYLFTRPRRVLFLLGNRGILSCLNGAGMPRGGCYSWCFESEGFICNGTL